MANHVRNIIKYIKQLEKQSNCSIDGSEKYELRAILNSIRKILVLTRHIDYVDNIYLDISYFECILHSLNLIFESAFFPINDIYIYAKEVKSLRNIVTHEKLKYIVLSHGIYFNNSFTSAEIFYNKFYIRNDGYIDIQKFGLFFLLVLLSHNFNIKCEDDTFDFIFSDSQLFFYNTLPDLPEINLYLENRNVIYFSHDYVKLKDALRYFEKSNNSEISIDKFHCIRFISQRLFDDKKYEQSLEYMNQARKQYEILEKEFAYIQVYQVNIYQVILVNQFSLNHIFQDTIDTIHFLEKLLRKYRTYLEINDYLISLHTLANCYSKIDLDKEKDILTSIKELFYKNSNLKTGKYQDIYAGVMNSLIANAIEKSYEISNIDISEITKAIDSDLRNDIKNLILYNLANYFYKRKEYDKSERHFNHYLNKNKKLENYEYFYSHIHIMNITLIKQKHISKEKITELQEKIKKSEIIKEEEKERLLSLFLNMTTQQCFQS